MQAFFDKGGELWTRKFIRRSLWRFYDEYDEGDLLSEAWFVFDRVVKKYGDRSIEHIMALYKTSLANQFHRLATQNRYRENLCDLSEAEGVEATSDPIVMCLVRAPNDVRDALAVLLNTDPALLINEPSPGRARRETYDERFHRIIDGAPKDIATKIRDFLREGEYVMT